MTDRHFIHASGQLHAPPLVPPPPPVPTEYEAEGEDLRVGLDLSHKGKLSHVGNRTPGP